MPMAGVEPQIAVLPASQHRQVVRGHRPEPRPHLGTMVVGTVGIQLLYHRCHEREVGRFVAGVVAGEFRRRGDAHAIAEA